MLGGPGSGNLEIQPLLARHPCLELIVRVIDQEFELYAFLEPGLGTHLPIFLLSSK